MSAPRGTLLGLVVCAAVLGPACAETTPAAQSAEGAAGQARRARPRRRAVTRALGEAAQRAIACLPPAAQGASVRGAFVGETGAFAVDAVEGQLGTDARDCVRQEFEAARVPPFREERFAATQAISREGAQAEALAGGEVASSGGAQGAAGAAGAVGAAGGGANGQAGAAGAQGAQAGAGVQGAQAGAGVQAGAGAGVQGGAAGAGANGQAGAAGAGAQGAQAGAGAGAQGGAAGAAGAGVGAGAGAAAGAQDDGGVLPARVLASCYRSVLRTDTSLAGRFRLQFAVTNDGVAQNVRSATIGTPVGRPQLFTQAVRCIEQRVRQQTFGRPAVGENDFFVTLTPDANGEVRVERTNVGLLNAAPGAGVVAGADGAGGAAGAGAGAGGQAGAAAAANNGAGGDAAAGAQGGAAGGAGGALDLQQVAGVVRGRAGDIRACYQSQLARDASLQMRLRVRFTIEAAGTVSSASSTASVTSGNEDAAAEVARCVEGVVRASAFPARVGAAPFEATLPFVFAPSGAAGGGGGVAGAQETTGRVDPAAVSAVIREHAAHFRECYARHLAADPTLAGRVVVRFVVDPRGRVGGVGSQSQVRAGDPGQLGQVARCVERVMQGITLPAPTGGAAAVALPLDFGPAR